MPTDLPGFRVALAAFRDEYNQLQPHAALGLEPPARHYRPSRRRYRPHPPPWLYPSGSDVYRVDRNAMITYDGRRYFVGEALIGDRVACVRLAARVLVIYRHMYVRELHLASGRSRTLLQPADALASTDGHVLPMS